MSANVWNPRDDEVRRLEALRTEYPRVYWAGYGDADPNTLLADEFGVIRPRDDMHERWQSCKAQERELNEIQTQASALKQYAFDTEESLQRELLADKIKWPEYEHRIDVLVREHPERLLCNQRPQEPKHGMPGAGTLREVPKLPQAVLCPNVERKPKLACSNPNWRALIGVGLMCLGVLIILAEMLSSKGAPRLWLLVLGATLIGAPLGWGAARELESSGPSYAGHGPPGPPPDPIPGIGTAANKPSRSPIHPYPILLQPGEAVWNSAQAMHEVYNRPASEWTGVMTKAPGRDWTWPGAGA